MFDKPITSIQQAKEYFQSMGCSHFHMCREYPQRYEEYKQFKISKQIELEWITERFDEFYSSIIENKQDITLWSVHSIMDDLFVNLKTDIALKKLLEVTQHIRNVVPLNDRVLVSETINGRSDRRYRNGLIYLTYDLKTISAAKEFVELSLHFATYFEDFDRCQRSTKLCNDIRNELKL